MAIGSLLAWLNLDRLISLLGLFVSLGGATGGDAQQLAVLINESGAASQREHLVMFEALEHLRASQGRIQVNEAAGEGWPTHDTPEIVEDARRLIRAGNVKAAADLLDRLESTRKGDWYTALLLGRVAAHQRRHHEAVELFRLAETRYFRALAQHPPDHGKGPEEIVAELLGAAEDARARGASGWAMDPQLVLIYQNLTQSLVRVGSTKEAETIGKRGLLLQPNDITLTINLSAALIEQKRFAEAVSLLEPATTSGCDSVVWGNLGGAYLRLGRLDEAENALRMAIAGSPDSSNHWRLLGEVNLARGAVQPAIDALGTARKLNPDDHYAAVTLARATLALGEEPTALAFAREGVDALPNAPEAWVALAWVLFESSRGNREQLTQALAATRNATTLDWQLADAHLVQGRVLQALGDREGARTAYGQYLSVTAAMGCCARQRDEVRTELGRLISSSSPVLER